MLYFSPACPRRKCNQHLAELLQPCDAHTDCAVQYHPYGKRGGDYSFYANAATRLTLDAIEKVDAERCAVTKAAGAVPVRCVDIINSFWPNKYDTLYEAVKNNEAYLSGKGPKTVRHRYLKEDLPFGIAPIALLGIHQKTGIGRLSAYCGAISAGAAAGCGIVYLKGGGLEAIAHTLVNALAIVSGVICDGAKPSCAGKIAAAVDAGLLGYDMYCQNQQFLSGDGIVKKGVESMIASVGTLGRVGMHGTDQVILNIMLSE